MIGPLKRLLADEKGATAIEYGLIIALVFIAIISSVNAVASAALNLWGGVSENVTASM